MTGIHGYPDHAPNCPIRDGGSCFCKREIPIKKKKSHIGKGNWFEWEVSRELSKWLTGGADKTQLVRSVQSGGNLVLRNAAFYQVGDIAPNGPLGETFRSHFGVECKCYGQDPDWWHAITYKKWIVEEWWKKIGAECEPFGLSPLLVMRRNGRPSVVMMHTAIIEGVPMPDLVVPDLVIPRMGVGIITLKKFTEIEPGAWFASRSSYKEQL